MKLAGSRSESFHHCNLANGNSFLTEVRWRETVIDDEARVQPAVPGFTGPC